MGTKSASAARTSPTLFTGRHYHRVGLLLNQRLPQCHGNSVCASVGVELSHGVADMRPGRLSGDVKLAPDFFVPDDMIPPHGVSLAAKT